MHGLRQAALAGHIGISPAGLTNIVTGRHEPAVRTAARAAAAFGISIEELCGDRGRCLRAAVVAFDTAPVRRLVRAHAGGGPEAVGGSPAPGA